MITLVSKLCLEALILVPFTQPLLLDDYLVYARPCSRVLGCGGICDNSGQQEQQVQKF